MNLLLLNVLKDAKVDDLFSCPFCDSIAILPKGNNIFFHVQIHLVRLKVAGCIKGHIYLLNVMKLM